MRVRQNIDIQISTQAQNSHHSKSHTKEPPPNAYSLLSARLCSTIQRQLMTLFRHRKRTRRREPCAYSRVTHSRIRVSAFQWRHVAKISGAAFDFRVFFINWGMAD